MLLAMIDFTVVHYSKVTSNTFSFDELDMVPIFRLGAPLTLKYRCRFIEQWIQSRRQHTLTFTIGISVVAVNSSQRIFRFCAIFLATIKFVMHRTVQFTSASHSMDNAITIWNNNSCNRFFIYLHIKYLSTVIINWI